MKLSTNNRPTSLMRVAPMEVRIAIFFFTDSGSGEQEIRNIAARDHEQHRNRDHQGKKCGFEAAHGIIRQGINRELEMRPKKGWVSRFQPFRNDFQICLGGLRTHT